MVGSVEVIPNDLKGKIELLPKEFDLVEIKEPIHMEVENGTWGNDEAEEEEVIQPREIVLGRNVHTMSLAVIEPQAGDEITGDREAHMASVLARYNKSLIERSKHHLVCQNIKTFMEKRMTTY